MKCPAGRGFLTRATASSFASHNMRGHEPVSCECGRWHLVRPSAEQIAERTERHERERAARVAAYLSSVPERERGK